MHGSCSRSRAKKILDPTAHCYDPQRPVRAVEEELSYSSNFAEERGPRLFAPGILRWAAASSRMALRAVEQPKITEVTDVHLEQK